MNGACESDDYRRAGARRRPAASAIVAGVSAVARLFLRLVGLVYLAAFASLWVQIDGLVGSRGILPAAELLDWVGARAGVERYWLLPTLLWLNASDAVLHAVCASGVLLALLLMLELAPVPVLALLYALYLSLVNVGQVFLQFQWDSLLLETGFLALFLAPLAWRVRPGDEPHPLAVWLLRWLLARLMLSSGIVKLASGDPTWRSLAALRYHYWTQPLPTWIGWWAHHLPDWFQTTSCALMFVVELAVPLLVFAPRRLRVASFFPLVGLQLLIAATGNYAFFNLLTMSLCVLVLDDAALPAWLRGKPLSLPMETSEAQAAPPAAGRRRRWPLAVLAPVAAAVLLVSVSVSAATVGLARLVPQPLFALYRTAGPFGLVNSYGLFAVMTTERQEIVVEGSDDGVTWRPYEFRWKPGDPRRAPAFVAPHQPRLDWQMWFAALGTCAENRWVLRLLDRIGSGSPPVLGLLATNPFPGRPPRLLRTVVYDYRFADVATHRKDGAWWVRELRGPYCPEVESTQESP